MKKSIIVVALLLFPLGNAIANVNSTAFRGGGGDRVLFHLTTDITQSVSSTSRNQDRSRRKSNRLALFIDANMDNLARDMSRGEGDILSTLAAVWGMSSEDEVLFNGLVQEKFSDIFVSENITSQEILINLNSVVSANKILAKHTIS